MEVKRSQSELLTPICAWCDTTLIDGQPAKREKKEEQLITHTICVECSQEFF